MHKVMDHAKFPFDHWSVMDQLLCHAVHNKVKHAASTKSWIMFPFDHFNTKYTTLTCLYCKDVHKCQFQLKALRKPAINPKPSKDSNSEPIPMYQTLVQVSIFQEEKIYNSIQVQ